MNRSRRRFLAGLGVLGAWAAAGCAPLARGARVVVIGGGYGGATAAKYVRLLAPDIRVYLVDPSEVYLSCPGSNDVLAGLAELSSLERSRDGLSRRWGVELVRDAVAAVDGAKRQVRLQSGASLAYDRLVVSPGIDFRWNAIPGYDEAASQNIPHAWKAGPQTLLLRDQLRAMPEDGLVVLTAPANPYRCPPGPYERASLVAHYLQRHKPRAKLLILDAKSAFSKQALFQEAWRRHYPGRLEWLPYTRTGQIERIDAASRTVHCEFETFRADVLNVIPPQQAGAVARQAGLADAGGWCPVHPDSFASTLLPDIHVIGDACSASPMPKSAFAAGSQAKACAVAVVASLQGRPAPSPTLINTCYSFVTPDEAVSVAGVYKPKDGQLTTASGGETPLDADWREEARYAHGWREAAKDDSFR
ncbi:NAD(P)/FAD-dependent oxidoreductase [Methylogaea oryzae]|uniref:Cytochrome c n=1 Tax=Methylogaea oryzae TaxID=1295382 RepID=A0A8D4VPB2_9GAMM|nr:NAD(P)/FAD-dependent oxidoreductase [Methylogaea oryzae]BBL71570.1 cytochrome c [Methylogaea oryzae]